MKNNICRIILIIFNFIIMIMNINSLMSEISILNISFLLFSFTTIQKKIFLSKQSFPYSFLLFVGAFLWIFFYKSTKDFSIDLFSWNFVIIIFHYYISKEDLGFLKKIGEIEYFNLLCFFDIFIIYILTGNSIYLVCMLILLVIFNIFMVGRKKYYMLLCLLVAIVVFFATDNKMTEFSNYLSDPLDLSNKSLNDSNYIVHRINKVIVKGSGDVPNDHFLYFTVYDSILNYKDTNPGFDYYSTSTTFFDPSISNVAYKLSENKFINKDQGDYVFEDSDNIQYGEFKYNVLKSNNGFFEHPYLYSFERIFKDSGISDGGEGGNQFLNLNTGLNYKNIFVFKPQFLDRRAIVKTKTMEMEFYSSNFELMPKNIVSVKVKTNNNKKDSIFTSGPNFFFFKNKGSNMDSKLKITYLDSRYISYDPPATDNVEMPLGYDDVMKKIAPEIGINKNDSVYEKEIKIQKFFQNNFKYSLKNLYHGHIRTMRDFLLNDREGYCEYFSSATFLISRYYKIPTKVASGLILSDGKNNTFYGNESSLHAWNLFWDGAGWISINMTPYEVANDSVYYSFKQNMKTISDMKDNTSKFINNIPNVINQVSDKVHQHLIKFLIVGGLFIFVVCFVIGGVYYYRQKNYNKYLEKRLKKDLKKYLKSYPKESYMPWRTWGEKFGDDYCLQKINEYYKKIY